MLGSFTPNSASKNNGDEITSVFISKGKPAWRIETSKFIITVCSKGPFSRSPKIFISIEWFPMGASEETLILIKSFAIELSNAFRFGNVIS